MPKSDAFDFGGRSGDGGRDVGVMSGRSFLGAEDGPRGLPVSLMSGAAPAGAFALLALLAPSPAEDEIEPFTQDVGRVFGKQLIDAWYG